MLYDVGPSCWTVAAYAAAKWSVACCIAVQAAWETWYGFVAWSSSHSVLRTLGGLGS
jgi:hypothetical protein